MFHRQRCPLCGVYFPLLDRTTRYCIGCWFNLFQMHLEYDGYRDTYRAARDADQPHPLIDRYYR
jgi:hypothetical protein